MTLVARHYRIRNTTTQACTNHLAILEVDCDGHFTGFKHWLSGVTPSASAPIVPDGSVLEQGDCDCTGTSTGTGTAIAAATRVADSVDPADLYIVDLSGRLVIPNPSSIDFNDTQFDGDGGTTPIFWNPDGSLGALPVDPGATTDLFVAIDNTTPAAREAKLLTDTEARAALGLGTAATSAATAFDAAGAATTALTSALTADTKIVGNRVTANYTAVAADMGKEIEADSTSAIAVTIPLNATLALPVGSVLSVMRYNTGACTVIGETSAVLFYVEGSAPASQTITIAGRGGAKFFRKTDTNTWRVS